MLRQPCAAPTALRLDFRMRGLQVLEDHYDQGDGIDLDAFVHAMQKSAAEPLPEL